MNVKLIISIVLLFSWLGQAHAETSPNGAKKKPKTVEPYNPATPITGTPQDALNVPVGQPSVVDAPPEQDISDGAVTPLTGPSNLGKLADQVATINDGTAAAPITNQDLTNTGKLPAASPTVP